MPVAATRQWKRPLHEPDLGSDSTTRSKGLTHIRWCAIAVGLTTLACAAAPDPEAIARCPNERHRPLGSDATPNPVVVSGDPVKGQRVYEEHCARCHSPRLADRSSRLFHDYPRLDCPNYLSAASDRDLTSMVLNGGEPYGLNKAMKPFADVLDAHQVADVVAYVRAGAAGR
jgi:mono/diheme cytochrome c family protein